MRTQNERDSEMIAAARAAAPDDTIVQLPDGRLIDLESRKGFGGTSQKLAYPKRDGYHRHWFNDSPGRIVDALNAGYTPVLGPDGKPECRVVDQSTGMVAYLHEVPEAWYQMDLAVSQRAADEKDAAILAGAAPGADGKSAHVGNQYGSIKMSRKVSG